jgi:chaperonin GroEL
VGAATEVELKEKKERVIDAVAATKAAIEEGIVIGGEMALYQAREILPTGGASGTDNISLLDISNRNFEKVGVGHKILYLSLQEPLKKLLMNAYGDQNLVTNLMSYFTRRYDSVILEAVSKTKSLVDIKEVEFPEIGHNVITGETVDNMFKLGIIDPAKVTRTALENAVSVAAMILTTDVLITDAPKKDEPAMAGGMPGGHMDY